MADPTITSVPGVEVGHYTDAVAATGVTVISLPSPNIAVVDVRGGGPGTRETGILGEAIKPVPVNAIVFAGGSAFGLAAADGVMTELEKLGIGVEVPTGVVPIVPSAIIYDLAVGSSEVRPTPSDGASAFAARSGEPVVMGTVGAGTGATINKWAGPEGLVKAGVGSYAIDVGEVTVGALVVLNAVGGLVGDGPHDRRHPGGALVEPFGIDVAQNTTLIAVATDAGIGDRNELRRIAIRAHDALAAVISPAHTRYDGDTVFVVDTGTPSSPVLEPSIDVIAEAAFHAVAESIHLAVERA